MTNKPINSHRAPGALGPYSQSIQAGDFLFLSGQLGLDPDSGEFVAGGVADQTTRALKNLAAVLDAAGMSLDQVVKTTVFLKSMDDFKEMNEAYAAMFAGHKPARAAVEVARLPMDALVEIEAIACR